MHYHRFDGTHIMSGRGMSSKPSMVGKFGINNGTMFSYISLSHVGYFNWYCGFLYCEQSCKFKTHENQVKYHLQFLQNCTKLG